ncbi:MAG TPA: c-type cytochrome [Acidobacteriaceae bacterium]|nr:c-type cytochrome [Terriglobia bacterium]HVC90396.1 c-type cytochrome [Acidobacteriaceae bacterium]
MKKLQAIAFAAILGTVFYQTRRLPLYAASVQSSAQNQQSGTPTSTTGPTRNRLPGEEATPPPGSSASKPNVVEAHASPQAEAGASIFQQNCAFCHGRDAGGGETGPDLTRSKLVSQDVAGSKISEVLRDGRPDKGMPSFNFSPSEVVSVAAFIHWETAQAQSQNGKRRGVEVSDLQTGNVAAGQQYFQGAGGCASCHSPTGDLAGIASRYQGLQLEERMLYPKGAKSTVTVTEASGKKITGTLAYRDEFTIGLIDADGMYHSWPTGSIRYSISSPVDAHVALFSKYTDADIHNLMAYLQTLK